MKKELPNGWKEKTIGEIFQFIKNYSNSRAELNDYDEISYIHYGDIHKYYRHRIECDKVDFPKISAEKLSKDINKISYAKNGDLIVVDASEDYEGTCISAEIKNLNYKLVSGLHTFLLRDENKIFADGYRGYIFYNHDVHIQCCKVATGISVYGISQENLKNIKVMIPPLDEQKRIAEILSTFDDLIENLTKLIEKKELYKKGVMQRVLSGEVRFEGFTDEWKTMRLGDIVEMSSGGTPNTKNKEYYNGNIVWVTIKDITSSNKFLYDSEKKITKKGLENSSAKIFPINTILYAMYASIGECVISKVECATSQAILGMECSNRINFMFLYYLLLNNKNNAKRMRQTGTQPNLNKQIVSDFEFNIPSLEEQNKIAELLTLIDKDIDNLKKMLQLRKLQKKGVMQKLLTGEVRV